MSDQRKTQSQQLLAKEVLHINEDLTHTSEMPSSNYMASTQFDKSKLDSSKMRLSSSQIIENRDPIVSPRNQDYNRLKYYSVLRTGYQHLNKEEFLQIPKHVLDERLYVQSFAFSHQQDGKHGSITTIFSVWNSMVGTGLLTIPWAYSESGFMLGMIITLICFLISFYTCYLVLKTAGNDQDYTETLKKHFGKTGWTIGMILFIGNLTIPIILYFQLLAQNLYPILLAILRSDKKIDTSIDFNEFSYSYTCIIILFLLFAITAIRNLSIFVRFNTLGVVFIFMIIIFIISVGLYAFTNTDFVFEQSELTDSQSYIMLFNSNFPPLMGILGGGYYLHNISLPIIRNSRNPDKNIRDVFIGYLLVFLSYTICGVLGYFGFKGKYFTNDMGEFSIKSNCLLMFDSSNIFAIIIRFCVFCQLLAAMSLIFACQRAQICLLIFKSQEMRSIKVTILINACILIIPFILAVFYPQVGKLAGYLGSFTALALIYVMPTITHLKDLYTQIENPILAKALKMNEYSIAQMDDGVTSPKIRVKENFLQKDIVKRSVVINKENVGDRKKRFIKQCVISGFIIAFGIFVVISQYI